MNFLTMLSGNTVSQLIPFVMAPILSRLFTPVEFAVLANFMAIVGMLGIVSTGRLELAVPLPKEKEKAQDIVFTGLIITLGLGMISLIIPLFSNQIGILYNDELLGDYLWMVPFSVVSFGLLGLMNNWNLRHEKFRSISIGKVTQSIVNNGLAAILGYIGWGINGLIIAWLLSQYVNVLVLLLSIDRKVKRSHNSYSILTIKSTLKEYKDFPLINSMHAFTDIFVTQFVLFWLISSYFGYEELGLFAMMHKYVKAPIILISGSVSQLFYIEAGKAINENRSLFPILKKTVMIATFFAIPFVIVLLVFGPQLFKWYLGSNWMLAGTYAQCITPMLFFFFIVSPISGIPILFNKQKTAFWFSVLGYSISISCLLVGLFTGLNFVNSLVVYGIGFGFHYIALFLWYIYLIRKYNEKIH